MSTNPVATYVTPNFTTQDAATYKTALDGGFMVAQRFADMFAPHAQTVPNMTVSLDPGFVLNGTTLTEVAAQTSGAIVAPVSNPRIDRAVISLLGVLSIVTGVEAGSPTAPAIPANSVPVAQIALAVGQTSISNTNITDERVPPMPLDGSYQEFTTSGTWAKPAGYSANALVTVLLWAPGGGGGSNANGGGGGGGGCQLLYFRLSDLSSTETVTIPAGGAVNTAGGNSTFGAHATAFGGGPGASAGVQSGSGGGNNAAGANNAAGGGLLGGAAGSPGGDSGYGGGGAGNANGAVGGNSYFGGAGGGAGNAAGVGGIGGNSVYGGGGGGSHGSTGNGAAGTSVLGGNGGADGVAGSAPGGGGGRNAAGGRGECRVWVTP